MGLATAELQQALYDRLTGDADLMAAVSGVFDAVPSEARPPYVVLGPVSAADWSTKTFHGQRHSLAVRIYSSEAGDLQVKTLADKVYRLLTDSPLGLATHSLVSFDLERLQTLRDADGVRQAALRFAALTHAN